MKNLKEMKKIFNISLLAVAAVAALSLGSCKNEVDDVFDSSAAERLAQAKQMYEDLIVADGGKWQMEYFANADEPGYVYVFEFKKDGSVVISGDNKYIAQLTNIEATRPAYGSQESLWEVITDNGPTLTFNSYNDIFHLFSTPEDILDTDGSEQGYGHEGDYEFSLMKYSGDTLYLSGKKRHIDIYLTRLAPEVEPEQYLTEVVNLASEFFNVLVPDVYITLPNGRRYLTSDGSTLILGMCPEDLDWISYVEYHNAIITPAGLRFMEPIILYGSEEAREQEKAYWKENPTTTVEPVIEGRYKVQTFVKQEDGSLLCKEDGVSRFAADAFNRLFGSYKMKWRLDATALEGELADAYQACADGLTARDGSTITTVDFLLDHNVYEVNAQGVREIVDRIFTVQYTVKRKRGGSFKMNFYYRPEASEDGTISLNFDGRDTNANNYAKAVAGLESFIALLGSKPLTVTSENVLAPTIVQLHDGSDSYLTFKAYK